MKIILKQLTLRNFKGAKEQTFNFSNNTEISNAVKTVKKRSPIANYNGFDDAYGNIPNKHTFLVRRELQKRLHWSPRTFAYKRSGEFPLRENEVPVIQEIFARFGLNAFTGEKL